MTTEVSMSQLSIAIVGMTLAVVSAYAVLIGVGWLVERYVRRGE